MIALELKQTWRETGVQLVLAAVCLVLIGSLWQGWAQVSRTEQALAESLNHEREFRAGVLETSAALDAGTLDRSSLRRDPHDVASFGSAQIVTYARLTPAPLSALSAGQSALFPSYVALNTGSRDKTAGSTEVANPESLQAGPIDAAFVLVYLLPLALIAIGYGVRANERETGVDVLIRTAALQPWRVYARRILLRAGLLYAVVSSVLLAAALLGVFSDPWLDLLVALGLIAVYLLFWYAVVTTVALTAPSGAVSALRSISIWVVLLVLVPAAANMAARLIAPVPSRAEFVQAVRDATDAVETQRASLLEKYLFDHPEMTGADATANAVPAAIATLVTRRAVEQLAGEVDARYQRQLNRQEAVIARFEYFSPAIWLQNALNRLSGTDSIRYRGFLEAVGRYHEQLRAFFETILRSDAGAIAGPAATGTPGDRTHFHYPVFDSSSSERLPVLGGNSGFALGLILVVTILLLVWTRSRFDRSVA